MKIETKESIKITKTGMIIVNKEKEKKKKKYKEKSKIIRKMKINKKNKMK